MKNKKIRQSKLLSNLVDKDDKNEQKINENAFDD